MWYELAARGGDANGAKLTKSLQSQLNDQQRAIVTQLVEGWLAEHPNVKAGS